MSHKYGPHDPESNPKTVEVYPRERYSEPIDVPVPAAILRQRERINTVVIFRRSRSLEEPITTPVESAAPADLDPETWEPGVPLYPRSNHAHSQYLFNFREDPDSEGFCGDRADWPGQTTRRLPDGDEIGEVIEAERAWREAREEAV